MQRSIKTRIVFKVALASLAAGALIACGDSRINKLTPGISRDSALKVINEGTSGDSLARVYKQETYLVNGQMTNVLFYNKDGVKQKQDSTLAPKAQTPIVTVGGKVTGWGWAHYDSVAKAMNFKPSPGP
jgi:hypothetical protein